MDIPKQRRDRPAVEIRIAILLGMGFYVEEDGGVVGGGPELLREGGELAEEGDLGKGWVSGGIVAPSLENEGTVEACEACVEKKEPHSDRAGCCVIGAEVQF